MSNFPPVSPMPTGSAWKPKSLVLPVLVTLCCCLVGGIVAIVYTSQANTAGAAGDVALAEKNAKTANVWMIVSAVLGVIGAALYMLLMAAGAVAEAAAQP
jgi:L-lactate permease